MHLLAREDEFSLSHGGNTVRLRASLRAAIQLERLHDGFGPLFRKLEQFDTATVRRIILTAATDRSAAEAVLSSFRALPLSAFQKAASGPIWSLCAAFLPDTEAGQPDTPAKPRKVMTWAEVFTELYQIGTGWLGWTPAETLAATPAEIGEALTGFVAMQQAIHGTPDEAEAAAATYTPERLREIDELGHDPAFDRAGLQALKARL